MLNSSFYTLFSADSTLCFEPINYKPKRTQGRYEVTANRGINKQIYFILSTFYYIIIVQIERLKKKIKRLEQCATDVTQTQNITGTTELLMLREKTKADETKIERLKEICKSSIHEFRDVCYMMLGYKIDRSNTSYR